MKKLLNTRDILLLGLSGTLDLFEEIRDPLQLVSKSYEAMYGWVPERYKRHNFNHLVWRNIKTGYIEKIEKEGEVFIRLTSRGSNKVVRDFPFLSFQNKKWDKKWRVVVFDVEETNKQIRERFRSKLKELGFGMLQKSVFITPHDVLADFAELAESQGLSDFVYVMEVSYIAVGDVKTLANRVWNLERVNNAYLKLIEKIEENHLTRTRGRMIQLNHKKSGERNHNHSENNGNVKNYEELVREIRQKYLGILLQDPFLPKDLLPYDWAGEKARLLIKSLKVEFR